MCIRDSVWDEIDKTIVDTLKKHLVCRRFLSLFGPLGAGVSFIPIDSVDKTEVLSNGFGEITGRKIVQIDVYKRQPFMLWYFDFLFLRKQ